MRAEQYVNKIVKKVKCSQEKRKEIKKQIEADISVRVEQGETLEAVMESMGTAEEIADEFNQNLSKEEQKAYSRSRIWEIISIIAVIFILIVLYIWRVIPKTSELGSSGVFTQQEVEEKVEEIILLLDEENFDALRADATGKMQEVLTKEKIDEAKAAVSDDWGEVQAIGTIYTAELKQKGKLFAVAQVHVTYENTDVMYTISFDENMKFAGIYW